MKRRKVVRVGAAYLALALGVLEGADLVFPSVGLGSGTFNALVLICLLGFPSALLLAWTFDLDGGAIRRTRSAEEEGIVMVSDPWVRLKAALVGAGFVAVAAWGIGLWRDAADEDAFGVPDAAPVLAVLPFQDLSPEGDQAYFADGLHEELLHQLGALPGLDVVSRPSVMHFRDSPASPRALADSLGARYLLGGSVRRAADSVRVTVHLMDATTEVELWSESYSRALSIEGLLDLQRTLAERLARSLGGTLGSVRVEELGRPLTRSLEAYNAFLRGRHHWYEFTRAGMVAAEEDLRRALELDPEFGLAHGLLALVYTVQNNLGMGLQGERFARIREHAELALRYAPEEAQSHFAMAAVSYTVEWDWAGAQEHHRHALALDPGFQDVLWAQAEWYGIVAGETERALEMVERALRVDPFAATAGSTRAAILHFGRRYAEAADEYRRLRAVDPANPANTMNLISNLALSGRKDEARRLMDDVLPRVRSDYGPTLAVHLARVGDLDQARAVRDESLARREAGGSVPASRLAAAEVAVGNREGALTWLERCFAEEGGIYTLRDPLWDPLRGDPRFQAIWDRVGLPGAPPESSESNPTSPPSVG